MLDIHPISQSTNLGPDGFLVKVTIFWFNHILQAHYFNGLIVTAVQLKRHRCLRMDELMHPTVLCELNYLFMP